MMFRPHPVARRRCPEDMLGLRGPAYLLYPVDFCSDGGRTTRVSAANAAASAQDWPLILDSINPNAADERAYREDFEVLVRDHCGEFAAYHDGRLLCTDREEEIAYRRARLQVPEGVIYLIPIRPR